MAKQLEAKAIVEGGRKAVRLENASVRAVIEAKGGMIPEFSLKLPEVALNAHWLPAWRPRQAEPWSKEGLGAFYKGELLYHIAGDFPCSPNFGPDCLVDGVAHPAHGWTAQGEWRIEGCGVEEAIAWARFTIDSPDPALPLSYEKLDMMIEGQPAIYSMLTIRNSGAGPVSINVARHTTLGAPFLAKGCRISLPADRFLAAPSGTEFDDTGRLAGGAEFASLQKAPLRSGGTVDISHVPGLIGFTDLVTGAIPAGLALGWSCVVNPALNLAYVCFFPGAAGLPHGEIALSFNDLWMQYGGRRFTPWAETEGGVDRIFCLGTENATGAFANGLGFARANPSLLGKPTLVEIPSGGERRLCYGNALLSLEGGRGDALVAEGVAAAEIGDGGELVLKGRRASERYPLSADFAALRRFAAEGR
ncbi:MAG TPA: hypothetical protein VMV83_02165 [Rectinemataceae bacterium]|nr:hypothetical protein [Rectinemataceae bacterium]